MSDFKVKLQKLINSSYSDCSLTIDKSDAKPKKECSKLKRDWSIGYFKKTSNCNKADSHNKTVAKQDYSSNMPKRQSIKLTKGCFPQKIFQTIAACEEEEKAKNVETLIRSCTPQEIHMHHPEPILFSTVHVNEPECAMRNKGRMRRKVYWMNQHFLFKDKPNVKSYNHPIRGTKPDLNVNKSEILSRSPNHKSRVSFEGEFRAKIKKHLFQDSAFLAKSYLNSDIARPKDNCTVICSSKVDYEVERYRKDFMKVIRTNLSVLNK